MSKQSILTFDRWDFVGTRFVLAVIALAVTGFGVISPVVQWLRGEPLTWLVVTGHETPLVSPEVSAKEGVDLTWPGEAEVSIPDASVGAWLASILPAFLVAIATIVIVVSLMRLLSRIETGDGFGHAALRTLRLVGFTLLVGSIVVSLAGALANVVVLDSALALDGEPAAFTLEFGASMVVAAAGLVCAAIAEAFGRLADDVEGLV